MTKYYCHETQRLVITTKKKGCPFCSTNPWFDGEPCHLCLESVKRHGYDVAGKKHGDYIDIYKTKNI